MVKVSPLSCASDGTLSETNTSVGSQELTSPTPTTQKIVFQIEMTPIRPTIQIKPQSKSIKKDRSPKKNRNDDSKSDSELEVDTMDPP